MLTVANLSIILLFIVIIYKAFSGDGSLKNIVGLVMLVIFLIIILVLFLYTFAQS